MKITSKRLLSIAAAAAVLTSFAAVNAEYNSDLGYAADETPSVTSKNIESADGSYVIVNGLPMMNRKIVSGNTIMIPLREVAENLGYTVVWNDSEESAGISRGDCNIKLTIGKPASVAAKSGAESSEVPVLINDSTTYIPLSYIGDVIPGRAEILEDGSVKITELREIKVFSVSEDNTITADDPILGEVMVLVTDETEITRNGESADIKDITENMLLNVLYSPEMTLSLPPHVIAEIIEIPADNSETEEEESMEFSGIIKEIDEEGAVIVKLESSDADIALIINDSTGIAHAKNKRAYKAEDLEEGMRISGKHSKKMTRSIPPQASAIEIIIAE